MIKMKCSKCGFENKDKAKFCTKCGSPLNAPVEVVQNSGSNNMKYVIIALIIVIIMLIGVIGYFALNSQSEVNDDTLQTDVNADEIQSGDDSDSQKTTEEVFSSKTTTQVSKSKEWVSIGSYSGSGSGSQTINVPAGKIKVELSAYPILNYATNNLYVSGPNGEFGGVDWGPKSSVETRSDSFICDLNSDEEFVIDYYETENWQVEFFRYQ